LEDDDWLFFPGTNSNFDNTSQLYNNRNVDNVQESNMNGPITGLHWNYNGCIASSPKDNYVTKETTVKDGYKHLFNSLIDATLAIFPITFWEIIVREINRYAEQKLNKLKGKKQLIAGYKWKPVTLSNIMTYFGLLVYAMLYP
jgi:hypothetical protein